MSVTRPRGTGGSGRTLIAMIVVITRPVLRFTVRDDQLGSGAIRIENSYRSRTPRPVGGVQPRHQFCRGILADGASGDAVNDHNGSWGKVGTNQVQYQGIL